MRLLLVDLDARLLDILKSNLSFLGYTVETTDRGATALAQIEKQQFTIVLTGDELADMSGVEFTRKLRASIRTHGQYLILMSRAHGADFTGELARPDEVLLKPFSMAQIIGALIAGERRLFETPPAILAA